MRHACALLTALLLGTPAFAEPAVGDCEGWQANARNVDWTQPSPTYAEGAIRLVALDTVEPAAAAYHVLVLMTGAGGAEQTCQLVSAELEGAGFAGLDLARAVSSYNPATGLTVTLPVTQMLATGDLASTPLLLLVNQSEGTVTATLLN
jgi:hypothetical protein